MRYRDSNHYPPQERTSGITSFLYLILRQLHRRRSRPPVAQSPLPKRVKVLLSKTREERKSSRNRNFFALIIVATPRRTRQRAGPVFVSGVLSARRPALSLHRSAAAVERPWRIPRGRCRIDTSKPCPLDLLRRLPRSRSLLQPSSVSQLGPARLHPLLVADKATAHHVGTLGDDSRRQGQTVWTSSKAKSSPESNSEIRSQSEEMPNAPGLVEERIVGFIPNRVCR